MGPDATTLVFWMLTFKPTFSLSSLTFIKKFFSFASLSPIRVVSSAYLRLLIYLPAILIPENLVPKHHANIRWENLFQPIVGSPTRIRLKQASSGAHSPASIFPAASYTSLLWAESVTSLKQAPESLSQALLLGTQAFPNTHETIGPDLFPSCTSLLEYHRESHWKENPKPASSGCESRPSWTRLHLHHPATPCPWHFRKVGFLLFPVPLSPPLPKPAHSHAWADTHVHTHAQTHPCTHRHIYRCTAMCTHTCTNPCSHMYRTYLHIYTWRDKTSTHAWIHTHVQTHTYTCKQKCTYAHTHTHTHTAISCLHGFVYALSPSWNALSTLWTS